MSGSSSKMSVTQLTLLTALNMMGSGIIMLPTKLAEVGTFSIISWLVTAGGSTALAYAFAKCGMLSRNRGGMGGYAEYAFGKSGSFLANYAYCVSLLIANIAIAISAVGYAVALFGLNTTPFETCLAKATRKRRADTFCRASCRAANSRAPAAGTTPRSARNTTTTANTKAVTATAIAPRCIRRPA